MFAEVVWMSICALDDVRFSSLGNGNSIRLQFDVVRRVGGERQLLEFHRALANGTQRNALIFGQSR